ncbi:MAG: hypothetical protein VX821_10370 [Verrucomicrobiota bacterium]|jgi:predicted membrane GTPase involved in stress response|nr:hypothetical protein [Verrucomicrobiota bacterium]
MKLFSTAIISLLFAGSVFAGCPSKAFKGKVVGFDADSKTLTVKKGKKDQKIKVSSKTEMVGFDNPAKLTSKDMVEVHGCNCSNKNASKIAMVSKKK